MQAGAPEMSRRSLPPCATKVDSHSSRYLVPSAPGRFSSGDLGMAPLSKVDSFISFSPGPTLMKPRYQSGWVYRVPEGAFVDTLPAFRGPRAGTSASVPSQEVLLNLD